MIIDAIGRIVILALMGWVVASPDRLASPTRAALAAGATGAARGGSTALAARWRAAAPGRSAAGQQVDAWTRSNSRAGRLARPFWLASRAGYRASRQGTAMALRCGGHAVLAGYRAGTAAWRTRRGEHAAARQNGEHVPWWGWTLKDRIQGPVTGSCPWTMPDGSDCGNPCRRGAVCCAEHEAQRGRAGRPVRTTVPRVKDRPDDGVETTIVDPPGSTEQPPPDPSPPSPPAAGGGPSSFVPNPGTPPDRDPSCLACRAGHPHTHRPPTDPPSTTDPSQEDTPMRSYTDDTTTVPTQPGRNGATQGPAGNMTGDLDVSQLRAEVQKIQQLAAALSEAVAAFKPPTAGQLTDALRFYPGPEAHQSLIALEEATPDMAGFLRYAEAADAALRQVDSVIAAGDALASKGVQGHTTDVLAS